MYVQGPVSVDEIAVQAIDLAVPLHIPGLARQERQPQSITQPPC